jgi:hypothetical protein
VIEFPERHFKLDQCKGGKHFPFQGNQTDVGRSRLQSSQEVAVERIFQRIHRLKLFYFKNYPKEHFLLKTKLHTQKGYDFEPILSLGLNYRGLQHST